METFLNLLPPDLGPSAAIILLTMSYAGSLITVAFGIGGGALLLAVMAVLMPPLALIPVHGVVQLGSNLGRAVIFARHTLWAILPWFIVGSAVGVAIGGSIAVTIEPWLVQSGVGLFIIWSVLARPPRWLSRWPVITGLIASFLSMFFGATGVFVANFSKALTLPRHRYVATHATLMTVQHLLKSIAFFTLGFAFGSWLPFMIAMIATGLLGTMTGNLVLRRMSDARFNHALNFVLVVIAVRLIWSGLSVGLGG